MTYDRNPPDRHPECNPSGEDIASLRRESGLSQAQLADKLGVSTQSIYRWEHTEQPDRGLRLPVMGLKYLISRQRKPKKIA